MCDVFHESVSHLSLYCDSMDCRYLQTVGERNDGMDKEIKEIPLSESNVSLELAEIQKRCSDLLQEPQALETLTLEEEEPALAAELNGADPYNRS